MKTKLLIILTMLCGIANAQWTQLTCGTNDRLSSVFFTDSVTGYVTNNYYNKIYKTINGGSTWTILYGGSNGLNSVFFTNDSTGYAAGDNGTIIKTTNKGNTWINQTISDTTCHLNSIYFVNSDTGYAVGGVYGQKFIILKTTNGGNTWITQSSGTGNQLMSVHFTNSAIGCVVGYNGTIKTTADGGINWISQTFQGNQFLYSVFFTNPNVGYVACDDKFIYKTINGGSTWAQKTTIGAPAGTLYLFGIYFIDSNTGYATGGWTGYNGTILKTTDAGETWITQTLPINNQLYSIHFTDINNGYVVGYNGGIMKTNNGGTGWTNNFTSASSEINIFPNPFSTQTILQTDNPFKDATLTVNNSFGQIIKQLDNLSGRAITFRRGNLPSGLYFFRLTQGHKIIAVGKLVITDN